jgi:AcrR family transcriptional regulator
VGNPLAPAEPAAGSSGSRERGAPRDTATRILDAAQLCMGRDGLRVSMNAVAAEAGLSRRTVYHHYPTRDVLVGAVLERTVAAFVGGIAPAVDAAPTLADKVAEAAVLITRHRARPGEAPESTSLKMPLRQDSLLATVLVFHLDHLLEALVDFWVVRLGAAVVAGEVPADLELREVGEWIVRLTFSFALMPPVEIDLADEDAVRRFIRTHLRGIVT